MTVARFSRAPTRVKTSSNWSFLSVTSSDAGSAGVSAAGGSHDRGEAGSTAGASAASAGCAGASGGAGVSAVTGVCGAGFFGGAGMKNCVHTSTSATISTMASSWFRCIFLSCSSSNNRCSPYKTSVFVRTRGAGTGSCPPLQNGWHRSSRQAA